MTVFWVQVNCSKGKGRLQGNMALLVSVSQGLLHLVVDLPTQFCFQYICQEKVVCKDLCFCCCLLNFGWLVVIVLADQILGCDLMYALFWHVSRHCSSRI